MPLRKWMRVRSKTRESEYLKIYWNSCRSKSLLISKIHSFYIKYIEPKNKLAKQLKTRMKTIRYSENLSSWWVITKKMKFQKSWTNLKLMTSWPVPIIKIIISCKIAISNREITWKWQSSCYSEWVRKANSRFLKTWTLNKYYSFLSHSNWIQILRRYRDWPKCTE